MSKQLFFMRRNGERFWKQLTIESIHEIEDICKKNGDILPETLISSTIDTVVKLTVEEDGAGFEITSMEVG